MDKKINAVRNEPILGYSGDSMPKMAGSKFDLLPPIVKARLEIEKNRAFCPADKKPAGIKWNIYHKKVLGIMLMESDSPVSASLRAYAAGIMGPLNIASSIRQLTTICFDINEDQQTSINAVHSLLKLAEKGKAKTTSWILQIPEPGIRLLALKFTLGSSNKTLVALGKKYLSKEKNKEIIEILGNSYQSFNMRYSTQEQKSKK